MRQQVRPRQLRSPAPPAGHADPDSARARQHRSGAGYVPDERSPMAERVIVRCGRLIDGTGAAPRTDVSLVVDDGRIQQVVPTQPDDASAGAQAADTHIVDATTRTVMPGMMDLHVHL